MNIEQLDNKLKVSFKKLKGDMDSLKEEMSLLRSELRSVVRSKKCSKSYADNKVIKRYKQIKPDLVRDAISRLIDEGKRTLEIEDIIVKEKKLCGHTTFYKHLALLRSVVRSVVRSELRSA